MKPLVALLFLYLLLATTEAASINANDISDDEAEPAASPTPTPRKSSRFRRQTKPSTMRALNPGEPVPDGFCDPESDEYNRDGNTGLYMGYLYGWQGDAQLNPSFSPLITLDAPFIKIGKFKNPQMLNRYKSDIEAAYHRSSKTTWTKLSESIIKFRFGFECVSGCETLHYMERCVAALFKRVPIVNKDGKEASQEEIAQRPALAWPRSGWTEWYRIPDREPMPLVVDRIADKLRECGFRCTECNLQEQPLFVRGAKKSFFHTEAFCKTDGQGKALIESLKNARSPSRYRSLSPAPRLKSPPTHQRFRSPKRN